MLDGVHLVCAVLVCGCHKVCVCVRARSSISQAYSGCLSTAQHIPNILWPVRVKWSFRQRFLGSIHEIAMALDLCGFRIVSKLRHLWLGMAYILTRFHCRPLSNGIKCVKHENKAKTTRAAFSQCKRRIKCGRLAHSATLCFNACCCFWCRISFSSSHSSSSTSSISSCNREHSYSTHTHTLHTNQHRRSHSIVSVWSLMPKKIIHEENQQQKKHVGK